MKIAELKKDKVSYHARVTIPEKNIAESIDKELSNVAKTAKMPGFRNGKVPAAILKRKYGPSVRSDVIKNEVNAAIEEIIKKNDLNSTGSPAIKDLVADEGKDLEFTVEFEILPKIEMPDFKKISIEKPILKVEKKDIDDQIKNLSEMSKTYDQESKVKAKKGDQLTIDAVGYVDGKAFDGGKLDAHKLVLGSNAFIPGFEDQLIGSKTGDDVSVKVDFPKEYHAKDLAGKPSEFKVKVLAIHKESPVKIDDDFAKKLKCDNLEHLKEQVSNNIKAAYNQPVHVMIKMKLFDKLDSMLKFDIPKSLIEREVGILQDQTSKSEEMDDELKGKSDKEKTTYFEKLASRRVKIGLMLAEYIKVKKLAIGEEDLKQAMIAQARNYPGQEQQVFEFYQKSPEALESLRGPILEEKAVQEIFDKEIELKEKSYSKDKLEKLLD